MIGDPVRHRRRRAHSLGRALAAVVLGSVVAAGPRGAAAEPGCGPAWPRSMLEIQVDPGALAGQVARKVTVERGDTLSELAQRHLGTARRTSEVLALNPGLDPRGLRVGREVWLPPARAAAGDWVELYVVPAGEHGVLARTLGARILPAGPLRVFAVPQSRIAGLLRLGNGLLTEPVLDADAQVARSAPLEPRAAGGREFARGVLRVRVASVKGRTLELDVLEQSLYSDTGHRIALAAEAPLDHGSLATPLLLVLAGLLVFALVAWAARRLAAADAAGAGRSGP